MGQVESAKRGKSLKEFLQDPGNRQKFKNFFDFVYRQTMGYLYFLKTKGYQLSEISGSSENPIDDLTIDILGSFLRNEVGRPFFLIFDYFSQFGISSFKDVDSDELYDKFKPLLFRFIRQEISKLKNETDPQIAKLKRRINEIFKKDDYEIIASNPARIEYVTLSNSESYKVEHLPIIPYEEIIKITEEAFLKSHNRVEWCRTIFENLIDNRHYQKKMKKHELLSAIISVNIKYVEAENIRSPIFYNTEGEILIRTAEKSIAELLPWLRENILSKFIEKKRLTENQANCFVRAAEMYLRDYVYSPPIDLLPNYFREVMASSEHGEYLNKYKYVFETVIQRAEEEFIRKLKDFSTKGRNRNY